MYKRFYTTSEVRADYFPKLSISFLGQFASKHGVDMPEGRYEWTMRDIEKLRIYLENQKIRNEMYNGISPIHKPEQHVSAYEKKVGHGYWEQPSIQSVQKRYLGQLADDNEMALRLLKSADLPKPSLWQRIKMLFGWR